MPRFHMAKYIRLKKDGFVYDHNPQLEAREEVDVFEFDGAVPQTIDDLEAFLGGEKPPEEKPSRRKPKPE